MSRISMMRVGLGYGQWTVPFRLWGAALLNTQDNKRRPGCCQREWARRRGCLFQRSGAMNEERKSPASRGEEGRDDSIGLDRRSFLGAVGGQVAAAAGATGLLAGPGLSD